MFSGHQPSELRQAEESVEAAAMWAPAATVRRRGLSKEPLRPTGSVRCSSLGAETQEDARPETEELEEGTGQGCHSSVLQTWCHYYDCGLHGPSPKIRIKPHHPRTSPYDTYYTNSDLVPGRNGRDVRGWRGVRPALSPDEPRSSCCSMF